MKTILLMSCALCAGMNGYGNGMGIQEISLENNDVSKRKIQDGRIVTNSSSPKRIKKGDSPDCVTDEPHQEELDVVSDEKDSLEEIKETSRSGSEGDVLSRDSGNPSNQPPATKTHASNTITEKLKEGTQGSPDCVTAEPPKGFSVEWSPAEWEDYEARDQLLQKTRAEVERLLKSTTITPMDLKTAVEELANSSESEFLKPLGDLIVEGVVLQNIMLCLQRKLEYGNPPTVVTAAEKILDVLDSSSFDELFSDNCEEE